MSAVLAMLIAAAAPAAAARPLVVVDERTTMRTGPTPHGAIGAHRIAQDEVYHVVDGMGDVTSGAGRRRIGAGMAAYLHDGGTVGIRQVGTVPLTRIMSYPVVRK